MFEITLVMSQMCSLRFFEDRNRFLYYPLGEASLEHWNIFTNLKLRKFKSKYEKLGYVVLELELHWWNYELEITNSINIICLYVSWSDRNNHLTYVSEQERKWHASLAYGITNCKSVMSTKPFLTRVWTLISF